MTQEDCFQELLLKILELIEEKKSIYPKEVELFKFISTSISNYVVDSIRKSVIRNDSISRLNIPRSSEIIQSESISNYSTEENDELSIQLLGKSQDNLVFSDSQESEIVSNFILSDLLIHFEKLEIKFPGIFELFKELIHPSEQVTSKYTEYVKTLSKPRVSGYIPLSVVAKLIGYEKNYAAKLEKVIKDNLEKVFRVNTNSFSF